METVAAFEKAMSPRQISKMTNGTVSEEYVRSVCHRRKNPLPHVAVGTTRPHLKIRWSVFCDWYRKEESNGF